MSAVIISAHNNTLHCAEMSPAGTTMPSDVGTLVLHICTWRRVAVLVVCHHHNMGHSNSINTTSLSLSHFWTENLRDVKNIINVSEICYVWHQLPWNVLICSDLGPGKKQSWKSLFDVVQINIFHIFPSYFPAYLIFWYSKNIPKVTNYIIYQL